MVLVHTVSSLLSYAAFLVAFIAGILFLVQERQLKRKTMGALFHRLPSLDVLDRVNFASLGIGLGLLTVGVVFGFLKVEAVFGRWWTGDPKEVLTVGLWAAYIGLWVTRSRATLRGRRVAVLSIVGFCLVLFTLLGAGYLVPSLHPYL